MCLIGGQTRATWTISYSGDGVEEGSEDKLITFSMQYSLSVFIHVYVKYTEQPESSPRIQKLEAQGPFNAYLRICQFKNLAILFQGPSNS